MNVWGFLTDCEARENHSLRATNVSIARVGQITLSACRIVYAKAVSNTIISTKPISRPPVA